MNKRKVLIISDYFVPHWTGIVTSLTYFIEQYRSIYDITILTINHTNNLAPNELLNEVEIIRVPYQFSLSRAKYSFLFVPKFITLASGFDTIFINSPNSNIFAFAIVAKLFKKRMVIFHQGDLILTKGFVNRIIEKIFDFQTNLSCALADAVGTYTKDYAFHSRILSKFKYKLHTFLFIPKKMKDHVKLILPIHRNMTKNHCIFGFAGRYVEEKGVDMLLSAVPEVIKKSTEVHFYFAGDSTGYEKKDYFKKSSHLSEYVTNLGLLDKATMKSFLCSIDYLILPSRSDCFPLVQIEALIYGTPVIASNEPGIRVPVTETHYGFLFNKEDVNDLAEKIIDSMSERKNLGKYKKNVNKFLNQATYDAAIRTFIGK